MKKLLIVPTLALVAALSTPAVAQVTVTEEQCLDFGGKVENRGDQLICLLTAAQAKAAGLAAGGAAAAGGGAAAAGGIAGLGAVTPTVAAALGVGALAGLAVIFSDGDDSSTTTTTTTN